ncbi:MAG: biotin transporter BioY [Thermoanaerobacteraceae bacterium]|nr:biotin transporter BioY [Thermoanaerobacteraceae bacterium]
MKPRDMILVGTFAALTAVGAFIKVPVPVVPFTLQLLFVLFAGILLGSRLGLLSQLVYILVGLLGVPIFANGGGPAYVLQPTFGYLVGFALGAYITGKAVEHFRQVDFKRLLGVNLLALAVIYGMGVSYLYGIMNWVAGTPISLADAVWFGAIVCLPGDFFLSVIAAAVGVKVRHGVSMAVQGR